MPKKQPGVLEVFTSQIEGRTQLWSPEGDVHCVQAPFWLPVELQASETATAVPNTNKHSKIKIDILKYLENIIII